MAWKKPKFYYNTGIASLTATPAPAANYPVSNLLDGFDGTLWKAPDATTQTIKHDKGARRSHPFDFLTIVGHNFATSQPDVKLEYSDDDVTYQTAVAVPSKAAFSRASVAYHSDGSQAASGAPRYEADRTGKLLGAIMVEEATTNLLTANQAGVETDTTGFTALLSATLTRNTTYFQQGAASLRVVTPGSVINEGVQIDGPAGTISLPYAVRIKILAPLGATMELVVRRDATANATTYNFTGTGAWQDVSNVVVTLDAAATSVKVLVRTRSTAQAITFYIDMNQLEQKAYSTLWHNPADGARANESLSFPAAGILNPTEGAFAVWINVNAASKRQIAGTYPRIFHVRRSSDNGQGIGLYHNDATATWRLSINNGASSLDVADSYTPDGWHHFVATWSSSLLALYIDGVLRGSVASPSLASAFVANAYIGLLDPNADFLNTSHDDVQTWNRALTDAEIAAVYARTAAKPHPASAAFFTFDQTLVNGVLLNPLVLVELPAQLSSRYQKLTLTNSLVAPYAAMSYWGEGTELDYCDASFDPNAVEEKANVNLTETGYLSGVHTKFIERDFDLTFEDAEDALYQKLKTWNETAGLTNFVTAWEGAHHGEDCFLMRLDKKFANPLTRGGARRNIMLSLRGRKLS